MVRVFFAILLVADGCCSSLLGRTVTNTVQSIDAENSTVIIWQDVRFDLSDATDSKQFFESLNSFPEILARLEALLDSKMSDVLDQVGEGNEKIDFLIRLFREKEGKLDQRIERLIIERENLKRDIAELKKQVRDDPEIKTLLSRADEALDRHDNELYQGLLEEFKQIQLSLAKGALVKAASAANLQAIGYYTELKYDLAFKRIKEAVRYTPDNLALLIRKGDYAEGVAKYEVSRAIYETVLPLLEQDPERNESEIARVSNNLGFVYHVMGNYAGAIERFERSLEIDLKVFGPDHPTVATSLSNLGSVYDAQRDYGGAIEKYKRALDILEKAFGPDHPNVATGLNNLGSVYDAQGEYAKAIQNFQRSLDILERAFGPDHSRVASRLNNLGSVYDAQGKYAKAIENYEQALEAVLTELGSDHLNVGYICANLGAAYKESGKIELAKEYLGKAMRIGRKKLGGDPALARRAQVHMDSIEGPNDQ